MFTSFGDCGGALKEHTAFRFDYLRMKAHPPPDKTTDSKRAVARWNFEHVIGGRVENRFVDLCVTAETALLTPSASSSFGH
jgi:hypothetical protein